MTESASPQKGHFELVRAASDARSMSPLPPIHGFGSVEGSGAANENDHDSSARSTVTKRSFPGQFESYTRTTAVSGSGNSTAYGRTA